MLKSDVEVKVGMGLYLRQEGKSYGCIADVKRPYVVTKAEPDEIEVAPCETEWENGHYYCSYPSKILLKPDGDSRIVLHWSGKISGGCWWAYKDSAGRDYPNVAHFGQALYEPYLD